MTRQGNRRASRPGSTQARQPLLRTAVPPYTGVTATPPQPPRQTASKASPATISSSPQPPNQGRARPSGAHECVCVRERACVCPLMTSGLSHRHATLPPRVNIWRALWTWIRSKKWPRVCATWRSENLAPSRGHRTPHPDVGPTVKCANGGRAALVTVPDAVLQTGSRRQIPSSLDQAADDLDGREAAGRTGSQGILSGRRSGLGRGASRSIAPDR